MESNHYYIVEKSMTGQREIDEQTFESLAILGDRLKCLKKLGKEFAGVTFSSAVEKLKTRQKALVVN